jgi:simple sugar transport system substrate-binding protein
MRRRKGLVFISLIAALALVASACGDDDETAGSTAAPTASTAAPTDTAAPDDTADTAAPADTTAPDEPFKFGMILVGPENDRGWSQAHREGGEYLEEMLGAEMILLDLVNPADRPDVTVEAVAADMIAQGAQLVFATSDDMKDGVEAAAAQNPDVPMVWSSGDSAWAEGKRYRADLTNLANSMGQMQFGKMIAGCAAALTTHTGSIGYVGPLINDETRLLVNSVYLGANYCWTEVRGETGPLAFEVNWIGVWFNIPGFTLDPTALTNDFFDGGADVVISGIDTTEVVVRTGQRFDAGEAVYAIPYDFEGACSEAPATCLGVPYFNWGPSYLDIAQRVIDGTFSNTFEWNGPDWSDINNPDTSAVGWIHGDGLLGHPDRVVQVDEFIAGLGDGSIDLYVGPLNWQDGSTFLGDGEVGTDQQVWYAEQLLEGIVGASSAE